jgi:hypothetical protein
METMQELVSVYRYACAIMPSNTAELGPRELSILDAAAIPILYGPKSQCTKSMFYQSDGGHDDVVSINGIRDPAKYRPRRRAWDRGMSVKGMRF